MMFQEFLTFGLTVTRIHCGLYPDGGRRDPCVVKCGTCSYEITAPTWKEANVLAAAHDWHHNKAEGD